MWYLRDEVTSEPYGEDVAIHFEEYFSTSCLIYTAVFSISSTLYHEIWPNNNYAIIWRNQALLVGITGEPVYNLHYIHPRTYNIAMQYIDLHHNNNNQHP